MSEEPKILNTCSIGEIVINPKMLKEVADRIANTFDGEYDVNVSVESQVTVVEFPDGKTCRFLGFELGTKPADTNVAGT